MYVTQGDTRRLVTDKTDIERVCITENIARFSQSEGMPPMTDPLLCHLTHLYNPTVATAIMDGTFQCPPGTDPYAVLFIHALRRPEGAVPTEPWHLDLQTHIDGWKRQKENISSEPSNLTFSHYKAAIQDDTTAKFDHLLRMLPVTYGFSPKDWQKIVDVEILKKEGVYDIKK